MRAITLLSLGLVAMVTLTGCGSAARTTGASTTPELSVADSNGPVHGMPRRGMVRGIFPNSPCPTTANFVVDTEGLDVDLGCAANGPVKVINNGPALIYVNPTSGIATTSNPTIASGQSAIYSTTSTHMGFLTTSSSASITLVLNY